MRILVALVFSMGALFANICDDKINALKKEISYAEQYKESAKLSGLQTALKNLTEKCSNNKFADELKAKISKYEAKIEEKKADIEEAKAKGKIAKIKKEELKLQGLQAELESAKSQLASFLDAK